MQDVDDFCWDCKRHTVTVYDHTSGDTICTECALVLGSRHIDDTSEWRTFASDSGRDDHDPVRVGAPVTPLLDNDLLSITISRPAKTASTKKRLPKNTAKNIAAGGQSRENLIAAFHAIGDMADRLGLVSTIKHRARELVKRVEELKLAPRARNKEVLYAACLFIGCRQEGKPRTLKEIATVSGAATKDIGRLTTLITKQLGEEMTQHAQMKVVHAADYMRRFCSALGMANPEVKMAQGVATRVEKEFDIRRNPDSIAAAVIYMILLQRPDNKMSFKDVSMATGVADGTIKDAYKDLSPHAARLFAPIS